LRTFLALALSVACAAAAEAAFLDGDTLHAWCLSADVGDQEACLGYVVGVADALGAQGREGASEAALCLPAIDAKEAVGAVKQYLLVHPRPGSGAGADLVAAALAEAFPCP
jgi:Rap1a immunity proteins